ncbi:hypothetical protein CQA88_31525, partial [Klebsiella pneumoniae]
HRKGDGFIECGNGQVVTWCIGHLLEQAQPDAYDSRYARWNLADLPIVPEKWQLQPRPSVTKQLNVMSCLNRHRKGDGFIECGNGQVVTWCIGHLLEQAQPDAYD